MARGEGLDPTGRALIDSTLDFFKAGLVELPREQQLGTTDDQARQVITATYAYVMNTARRKGFEDQAGAVIAVLPDEVPEVDQ